MNTHGRAPKGVGSALAQKPGIRFNADASLDGAGWLPHQLSDAARWVAYLQQALTVAQSFKHPSTESTVLDRLALICRTQGQLAAARDYIQTSMTVLEARRAVVSRPDLQASFLFKFQERYEFRTELLWASQRAEPVENFAEQALQISEQFHARLA